MNIAVFGWYHHRNAGDDRIQYCLTRWLDGHTLAFLPAGRPPPLHLLRTYDAAIIGGGGLIMGEGGVFRNMAQWVRAAGIPVALVGVSIENCPPRLRNELRAFLDICCFAWFRDRESLAELGPHPKAFVAPDLTWLYPYPLLPPQSTGIALCLRKQADFPIEGWRTAVAGLEQRIWPWPLYFERGGDAALLEQILLGVKVPDEFQLEPVRNSAVALAGRFHGVLFALQTGRPVVAISRLPKTRRFLEEHDLARYRLVESQPEKVGPLLDDICANRDSLLSRIIELRSSLHNQAQEHARRAYDQLLDAAAALPPPTRRWRNRVRKLLDFGSYF